MGIRRVVTGHTKEGKATVVSDEIVDATTITQLPGSEYHELWSADRAPVFPDAGEQLPAARWFPPIGGFRFATFTVPPATQKLPADFDRELALQELEETVPGMVTQANMEADNPGMHTTDTIDFEYGLQPAQFNEQPPRLDIVTFDCNTPNRLTGRQDAVEKKVTDQGPFSGQFSIDADRRAAERCQLVPL